MIRVCCDQGLIVIKADSAEPDMTNNLVLKLAGTVVASFHVGCWSYFQVVDDE